MRSPQTYKSPDHRSVGRFLTISVPPPGVHLCSSHPRQQRVLLRAGGKESGPLGLRAPIAAFESGEESPLSQFRRPGGIAAPARLPARVGQSIAVESVRKAGEVLLLADIGVLTLTACALISKLSYERVPRIRQDGLARSGYRWYGRRFWLFARVTATICAVGVVLLVIGSI